MEIVHRIGIRAPAAPVYEALATIDGLAAWWTRDTTGDARVDGRIRFRFRDDAGADVGGFDMRVLEQTPAQGVRWAVEDGPAEWVGTTIDFRLSRHDDHTVVMFAHRGWPEAPEFRAHCSTKWATFLLSLRDLVETGRGRPAPEDLKLGDWH